jgi:hypothetical protein
MDRSLLSRGMYVGAIILEKERERLTEGKKSETRCACEESGIQKPGRILWSNFRFRH